VQLREPRSTKAGQSWYQVSGRPRWRRRSAERSAIERSVSFDVSVGPNSSSTVFAAPCTARYSCRSVAFTRSIMPEGASDGGAAAGSGGLRAAPPSGTNC
jgi:hypothetical protein